MGDKVVCAPKCPLACTKCDGGKCVDQCTDPCLECGLWKAGEPASCIPKCQAACSKCESGQCVDRGCPACQVCFPASRPDGSCQPVESFHPCIKCDPETGKETSSCSACEKCERGICVSNCPNKCEVCDNGTCRRCDRKENCEQCDEATGKCYGCNPGCERCSGGRCETTCAGGLACCAGRCLNCCGACDGDTCGDLGDAACALDAKKPACCGPFCRDLDSNDSHCGACDNWCRTSLQETCDHGICVCRGVMESGDVLAFRGGGMECPKEDSECCDGSCIKVSSYQSDPKHCGKCIVECEEDQRCEKGQCVGSRRTAYSLRYRHRIMSEKLGEESDVIFTAVVRQLAKPDKDGNSFVGWGTYEGGKNLHKVNCDNNLPMDMEEISLAGKAKGTASVDPVGGGKIALSFTITPLNPPKAHLLTRSFRGLEQLGGMKAEDLPDALLPVVGLLMMRKGTAKDARSFTMFGGSCSGMLTHTSEWQAWRGDGPPPPEGNEPEALPAPDIPPMPPPTPERDDPKPGAER